MNGKIDLSRWRIEHDPDCSEVTYNKPDNPFEFMHDGCGTWTAECTRLNVCAFDDSPEHALEELLDIMRDERVLLDAAIKTAEEMLK